MQYAPLRDRSPSGAAPPADLPVPQRGAPVGAAERRSLQNHGGDVQVRAQRKRVVAGHVGDRITSARQYASRIVAEVDRPAPCAYVVAGICLHAEIVRCIEVRSLINEFKNGR